MGVNVWWSLKAGPSDLFSVQLHDLLHPAVQHFSTGSNYLSTGNIATRCTRARSRKRVARGRADHFGANHSAHGKQVKFPILVTERWARSLSRCTGSQPAGDEVNHAIYQAVVCHCFLPGQRLPSQLSPGGATCKRQHTSDSSLLLILSTPKG